MRTAEENAVENLEIKNIIEPQLNIILTTDEDDERPVYISGNFNNWVTQDKKFELERVGQGLYHFKFENDFTYPDELLYKFTRGDWSEVEIDKFGNVING
jgi:Uma2 family endonuclease